MNNTNNTYYFDLKIEKNEINGFLKKEDRKIIKCVFPGFKENMIILENENIKELKSITNELNKSINENINLDYFNDGGNTHIFINKGLFDFIKNKKIKIRLNNQELNNVKIGEEEKYYNKSYDFIDKKYF